MKNFSFIRFTKPLQALLLALLMVPLFSSCGDEINTQRPDRPLQNDKAAVQQAMIYYVEFDATTGKNVGKNILGVLLEDKKTWLITIESNFDMSKLDQAKVLYNVSLYAKSTPAAPGFFDFKLPCDPINVTVTSEDGKNVGEYTIQWVVASPPTP